MTAQPAAHVMWTPDPIRQRAVGVAVVLSAPFEIRLPIADITP